MKKSYLPIIALLAGVLAACGAGGASSVTEMPSAESEQPTSASTSVASSSSAVYRTITAEEAKAIMDGGEPYILLDVRTQEEFDEGHIEGAILLPYDEIGQSAADALPDRDALILLYCRTGRRSALAAQTLADMGYTNVNDFGGIEDWPYEITQ